MADSNTEPSPHASPESTRYTHGHSDSVLASHRWRTAANSAAYLLERLKPGDTILDVGCGPGTITIDLARHVAPGRVIGIDSSAQVVDVARRAAADASVAVDFEAASVYELPYDDGAFDVIHAHQVLQHLGDPVTALREMRRVCRPGGLIAVRDADYAAMTWAPSEPLLDRWLDLYRGAARANGGEPDAGRVLLSWAQQAGLDDITATAGVWCFATQADRDWWASTWAGRISDSALSRQLVSAGMASQGELDVIAAGWRDWAAKPDGWFAVIHGELICVA